MQYDTLKDAKHVITLDEAIARELDMEFIDEPEEIHSLNDKLGIANMQVSCDVQIVNCTYGYCRRSNDPYKKTNKNCRLKLNAFGKELLAEHIRTCVAQDIREGRDETIEELVNTLQKMMK